MMATIMQALDGTIANVALPNMQGSLSATQEQVAWVITSYIVSAAIATPLAGFLRRALRPAAHPGLVGDRLHHRLDDVRRRPDAAAARAVPHPAGRLRRLAGAAQPGADDGRLHPRGAGQGDGDVGRRHHARADQRPDARRLADRRIFLALGILHQPAGRHPVRDRPHDPGQEQGERQSAAVRPARLLAAGDRHRHVPADARPRRADRLVQLQGDHPRGRPWRASLP